MDSDKENADAPAKTKPAPEEVPKLDVSPDRAERANDQANFLHERVEAVASVIVMGDVVGRDKVVNAKPKAFPQMPSRTLAKYTRFAAPRCMDEVRSRLASEKVIVLAAEAGWGKYALGVNLLNELAGEPHVVDADANLRTLAESFEAKHGYVIADVPPQRLIELSRDDVEAIVNAVEVSRAMLVITTSTDVASLRSNFRELAPDLGEPAPLAVVLRTHLRMFAKRDRVDELVADSQVLDRLRGCETRGDVCDLAAELVGTARGSAPNSLSLHDRQQLRTAVETWLRELGDAHWPYAFAAAVLDGMPADVALRGGAELSRSCRLGVLGAADRIQLLDDIKARSAPEYWYTRYGEVPVHVIRCRQQHRRPLVVELAWHHGAQLRGPMLRWLRRMGEHEDPNVVIAVGAAVGQLALHDFSTFMHEVIGPWAQADEVGPREAAVAALSVVAADDRFVPALLKLATKWSLSSPAEKWTALRAFGRPLGGHALTKALIHFKIACFKLDSSIVGAVADSMVELSIDGTSAQLSSLLEALIEWSGDERPALRTAAVFVFLRMCVDVTDMTTALPRLLRPGDARAVATVTELWARAIVHPDLHDTANKTAHLWARLCETYSSGPGLLAQLFCQVGRWPRERRLVQVMAGSWTDPKTPHPTPRCARAVTRAVERTAERSAG